MRPDLDRRLRAAGVDPDTGLDPRHAFVRLHAREGPRATLLRIASNEAKTSFILDAMSTAQAWAVTSGWQVGSRA